VSTAMDYYYTEPTSQGRAILIEALTTALKGTMSQNRIMAEKAMPILDRYNRYSIIFGDEDGNIDFDDSELIRLLHKAGLKIK